MSKEVKTLLRDLKRDGWVVEEGRHYKLRKPGHRMVVVARTPSCHHAIHNIRKEIERSEIRA